MAHGVCGKWDPGHLRLLFEVILGVEPLVGRREDDHVGPPVGAATGGFVPPPPRGGGEGVSTGGHALPMNTLAH